MGENVQYDRRIVDRFAKVALASLLTGWFAGAVSADEIVVEPIRFARGASNRVVSGSVIRGERALYSIDARSGQRMSVSISAVENNAVFQLYTPGAIPERRDYGLAVRGQALAGVAERDDASRWTGNLPRSGVYLVVVGSTRGNAAYSLTVEIR